ncbi:Polyketide synthase-nonribosomal peptide synthetase TwmB [Cladobotryum mycophilum]|uniref:Polyketide synthase-nonribosomal peptide synthetase TwmB n=1 Tax=Cladobotryum mycophilum TaxID=491253 RepID=A0ABR0SLG7_9HYPO
MNVAQGQQIAIIGSGCRFPGNATSPSKLWDLLRNPRCVAGQVPALKGYYHKNGQYHGHVNVKEAYLLAEDGATRRFDAAFFGISPAEANVLDPQIRLLLETVYEALETSGQTIDGLRGSDTAVYAGQMVNDYELLMYRDHENLGTYHATGTSRTMLSNRISYTFGWHGPSMTIDTACSSSLVALHHAVQQLRSGHSRVAVVAGSNLIFDVGTFIAESNLQMLSPEGRSRMWDAGANGYARGEGVAAVILKTREAAEEDGDHIECIIRETAVNQDGKTPGQTMPSASAQAQLIRDCYARAGLDLTDPAHHPQFFEAHGTGTPAGDPIEAEAISTAFFPHGERSPEPLLVGSIKTVIGHTEGTAGIAGLLKASLALRKAIIPPNLLFNRLNPQIEPFYNNLHIPTSLTPWPAVPKGSPRRASVNSFGFGGTNAHAILESYTPSNKLLQSKPTPNQSKPNVFTPFVFSASSETSLRSYLAGFSKFLRESKTAHDLRDIAHTLDSRRTRLSVATAVGASTTEELCAKLEAKLETSRADAEKRVGVRAVHQTIEGRKPRILGVFTGQGAQWAQMGLDLITTSNAPRCMLEKLQSRLDQLPDSDRPAWSLIEELQKDSSCSRISEAALSQPLCTAIQILQVDLVRAAGIEFTAVVGHSSGEIAAAYAAGFISAEDAICIAYYRGLHSGLSQDAQDLLDYPEFEGRACLAAVNSATSVTLSGDQEAIDELMVIFQDEKKFVRLLRVDKAYHSHHMNACSSRYLESLAALDIQISSGGRALWFSSVYGSKVEKRDLLKGPYWDKNMVNPVLFMQAVDSACASVGSFDLAIELGPHPALKGPALQTLQDRITRNVPYTGLLNRGASAISSFADGLGYAWTHLEKGAVNLQSYNRFVTSSWPSKFAKGLPTYSWDHDNEYWHESRYARAVRMRPGPVHELLGHLTPDSTEQDMRWRHILRLSEVQWLEGHRLQNVVVFPATGYLVSVLEAALMVCRDASVKLIEVLDVEIDSALVFDPHDLSVEIILSLTNISRRDKNAIEAEFKYHAVSGKDADALELKASGRLRIYLGEPSDTSLPARPPRRPNLVPVKGERFYESLSVLDYQYAGQFAALDRIERKLGFATGFVSKIEQSSHLIHPAVLDAALQSMFLTYAAPEDGAQRTMHIPRRIRRLTVNPNLCSREKDRQTALEFDSAHTLEFPHSKMVCDVDIYPGNLDHAMIQIQELECVPFSQQTARDDREVFSHVVWDTAHPDARITGDDPGAPVHPELAVLLERVAGFYLRVLEQEIPMNHPVRTEGPYKNLFKFASHTDFSLSHAGEWEQDTPELVGARFADTIDVKLLSELGENLVAIVKGEKSAVDIAQRANLIGEWYANGSGISAFTTHLAQVVKQLVHRNPHMHILETDTETDATTKAILQDIGSKFASYTVTGRTPDSLDLTQDWLEMHKHKMISKPLDLLTDPRKQGFSEASYDLVVASLALHTKPNLEEVLRNARLLLKPGGYLVMLELLPSIGPFFGVIFGAFSNWWLGASERGTVSPAVTPAEWDTLLRTTGFSGVDSSTPREESAGPLCVFVSQAMDDKIAFLRDPLSLPLPTSTRETLIQDLVILGGSTSKTTKVIEQLSAILTPYCASIRTTRSLPDFLDVEVSQRTVVLSLADLDVSVFARLNGSKWDALKKMLLHAETFVWVSQGRRADNPYANMILGLVRASARDNPALDYLLLDIEDACRIDHCVIAEALLRHKAVFQWRQRDNIHFAIENELVIDKAGRSLIPRLMMNKEMNDRYNSNHRDIRGLAQPSSQDISVSMSGSGWDIELKPPFCGQGADDEGIQLQTTHSLVSPVRAAEFGCMFLVLGKDSLSGDMVVALSSTNHSLVRTQKGLSLPVRVSSPKSEARLLWLTAHYLLASIALRGLSEDDRVLVYESSSEFAAILVEVATSLRVQVTLATTEADALGMLDPNLLVIHPAISDQAIARLANDDFSAFIDMSFHTGIDSIGHRIASAIPAYCQKDNLESLFSKKAWSPTASQLKRVQNRLAKAVARASAALANPNESRWERIPTISINELARDRDQQGPFSVLDWTTSSGVPINVRPVDSQVTFPSNKTYWLVGLTGGLGLSLCEWMVQRGARYFVITSRKPNVETAWLDEMKAKGAHVKISACDVTQRDQIITLHAEICSSMPPIAGVAQGVMVLQDTAIQDMTLDQLLTVTRPKVEGSIYLNSLFQENTLDFFVFFSSASSVVGNHGQANYGAANTFMASLAEKRRRQGLAASIIDIGAIFGVGYITRMAEGSVMGETTLQTGGYVRTSEREFHQLFGEAVLAGRPGSTGPIEIVSGVRRISQREEQQPVWESWPRMSHFVIGQEGGADDLATSSARANVPVKAQLENAQSREQIYDIVWDAFTRKLASHFHLDTGKMSKAELAAMRFDQMGIDSLTAVEIREWFMTTLEVKVPVLKILNGVSVGELVDTASETIPSRLIPNFEAEEETRSQASATSNGVADGSPSRGPDSLSDPSEETSSVTTSYESVKDLPTTTATATTITDSSLPVILKSVPVSFTQARFYPSGLFLEDRIGLNHTAWARITGTIDPERLRQAVRAVGEQHEILRTAFFDQDGRQMQHILQSSVLRLEQQPIQDESEVATMAMSLQKGHVYDVARGETVRLILLTNPAKEGFLIVGVHPLVMDATSLQTFLKWLAFHYTNPHTRRQVRQFAEASEQRHADLAAGKFEAELQYWRKEFATPPPPLPLLTLAIVDERPTLKAYENIRGSCRIGAETKKQIAALCRRLRATPFHFYLAVLRALLLRYTAGGEEDVTMAVAESGRSHDAEDMDVIGCLYNLVLVRLLSSTSTKFEHLLEAARDKTYAALANSKIPYPTLVKELNIQRASNCAPPVQVLVDYRTGQRETMQFGQNNQLVMMGFDLNVPYDVYLDTIDESGGECAHHIFLRKDMFGEAEAEEFAESYRRLILEFAAEPGLLVSEVDLY